MNKAFSKLVLVVVYGLLVCGSVCAQQVTNLQKSFSSPCPSDTFNAFNVTFTWLGRVADPSNEFVLELSSPTGDFSSPTELAKLKSTGGERTLKIDFQFPKNTAGDAYKLRVRSTAPASEAVTDPFAVYYRNVTDALVLNNRQPVTLCIGHPQTISVDQRNEAKYKWYKDGRVIDGQTGPSLEITQPGLYAAEVDYGTGCQNNTKSAPIKASSNTSSKGVSIEGSASVSVCPGSAHTLSAYIKDNNAYYIWYKDNKVIKQGKGISSYTTAADDTLAGVYYVEMGDDPSCRERSQTVTLFLKSGFTVSANVSGEPVLLPGKKKTIMAVSSASGVTYQWYKDGVALTGQTSPQIEVTQAGTYHAVVTRSDGCTITKNTNSIIIEEPQSFNVIIAYTNSGYTKCSYQQMGLKVSGIEAVTAKGEKIMITSSSQLGAFSFVWVKDNAETTLTGQQINLTKAGENGSYKVKTTLQNSNKSIPFSNALPIELSDSNYIKIEGAAEIVVCEGAKQELKASVKDDEANYEWRRDGTVVEQGKGKSTYQATEAGLYDVVITPKVGCPAYSNGVRIKNNTFTAELRDPKPEIYYPDAKNKKRILLELDIKPDNVVTTIKWYRDGNIIQGETADSYQVTQEGVYHAEVTQQGGCNQTIAVNKKYVSIPKFYKAYIDYKSAGESPCERSRTVIKLKNLVAIIGDRNEEVKVDPKDYDNYNFQWQRDAQDVDNAKKTELLVDLDAGEEGIYRLKVNDRVVSNNLEVEKVSFPEWMSLETSTVSLTSLIPNKELNLYIDPSDAVDTDNFIYEWYHGTELLQTSEDLPDTDPNKNKSKVGVANYFLGNPGKIGDKPYNASLGTYTVRIISKKAIECTRSLSITLEQPSPIQITDVSTDRLLTNNITVNPDDGISVGKIELRLIKDGTRFFRIEEKEVAYKIKQSNLSSSFQEGTSGDLFRFDESGDYILEVFADRSFLEENPNDPDDLIYVDRLELIGRINFIVEVFDVNEIPNVIMPNGAANVENTTWVLPSKYMNEKYKVTIYAPSGEQVLSQVDYRGDWKPKTTTTDNKGRAIVYFYIIEPAEYIITDVNGEEVVKKLDDTPIRGTITVLN